MWIYEDAPNLDKSLCLVLRQWEYITLQSTYKKQL